MVPPQVPTSARKPLSIAFEEISADKIQRVDVVPGDEDEVEGLPEGDAELTTDPA